jgi:hypothetical protein
MRYGDTRKRLSGSRDAAFKRLESIHNRQQELHSQYREYLDLQAEEKRCATRIERISAALQYTDDYESLDVSARKGKDVSKIVGVAVPADTPLWGIIFAVLEEVGECQVIELETELRVLGIETSRSAIESALKTHKNDFRVRMSGRNKFVAAR